MATGSQPGERNEEAPAAGGPQPSSSSKPGERALAVAAAGGSQLATLGAMPPPPARPPKRKEIVLDEDEWTASLEAIIERDFFPELAKLESKVAWLQAIRSGDPAQIRQAQLLIAQRRAAAAAGGRPMTGATPAGAPLFTPGGTAARALAGDTPYIPGLPPGRPGTGAQPGMGARPGTGARPWTGSGGEGAAGSALPVAPPVSLDAFLAAHTSEDNASFQEILESVNKRRRLKVAALLAPQPDPKLMITDGREKTDGFGTTGQAPSTLVLWKHEPKNALFYDSASREGLPFSDAELAAQVQGPPKSINRGATRFPRDQQPSASATPTTSSAGGGGGAAAAPGAADRPAAAAGVAGTRGYDILATPSFDPGAGGETPFMTWGEIEGTPMRIEAEDLPPGPMVEGPSFFIKEGTQREQASQALSSRAAAALRSRAGRRGGTAGMSARLAAAAAARRQPTGSIAGLPARPLSSARPPTGQQGTRPLSEAARRLASSIHRSKGPGGGDDFGLRASYRGATPGRRAGSAAATPAAGSGGWSAAGTPARGWATPSAAPQRVAATLEEEELRVQAVMKARQAQQQQHEQLAAARQAARQGFQGQAGWRPEMAPQPQLAQQQSDQQKHGGSGSGAGDLTAGLLNI